MRRDPGQYQTLAEQAAQHVPEQFLNTLPIVH
jgi:hypothetical protein